MTYLDTSAVLFSVDDTVMVMVMLHWLVMVTVSHLQ